MSKNVIQILQLAGFVALSVAVALFIGVQERDDQRTATKHSSADRDVVQGELPQQAAARARWQPSGAVTISDFGQAYPGFTLYPISGPEEIWLLNMRGAVVHRWRGIDVDRARLLSNCNLLALHGSKNRLKTPPWDKLIHRVSEYDWNGELVWSYTSKYHIHHEVRRLGSGNTLLMLKVPLPEQVRAGVSDSLRRKHEIVADVIQEVSSAGEVVWEWKSWEHLDVNDCGAQGCIGVADTPLSRRQKKDIGDWTHFNALQVIPENDHFDAGDQRFRPGNLMVMSRGLWSILIIDRKSGEVVWRYRGDYKGGMVRGHEAHIIPRPLPGHGNVLVLDNGFDDRRPESYILEIEPRTKTLRWVYDVGSEFYTRARGSVQRLPNGNTLISEDRSGRVFEVNSKNDIVWEYRGNLLVLRPARYEPQHCPMLTELALH